MCAWIGCIGECVQPKRISRLESKLQHPFSICYAYYCTMQREGATFLLQVHNLFWLVHVANRYNTPFHRYNTPFHRYNTPFHRYNTPFHRYNTPFHRIHVWFCVVYFQGFKLVKKGPAKQIICDQPGVWEV